jgi:FkbH-like protein
MVISSDLPDRRLDTGASSASYIQKLEWQKILFTERPKRSELPTDKPSWACQKIIIRVHRNQPFEFVASAMPCFLAFSGFSSEFIYGDYDDSLNFNIDSDASIEIIWLDFERYTFADDFHAFSDWLTSRLSKLRSISRAPILVTDCTDLVIGAHRINKLLESLSNNMPGVHICPQSKIESDLGGNYRDARMKQISGAIFSDNAYVETARQMALNWIPGTLMPQIKALVCDLDNTLYIGVIGEDGIAGLELTPAHRALQEKLVEHQGTGIFIAVLSKNEAVDVDDLFPNRPDFPLKKEAISVTATGWGSKAAGLEKICEELRISTDSVLVIDDNPGELAEIYARHPGAKFLLASDNAWHTLSGLEYYPGLFRWKTGDADRKRIKDLAAAHQRQDILAYTGSNIDFLASLKIRIRLEIDPHSEISRLQQLSTKTTQFNLSLNRFDEIEFARRQASTNYITVAIWLSDKLSDSGLIGLVSGKIEPGHLIIDEVCISCRALGRALEDYFLSAAIHLVFQGNNFNCVTFQFNKGERNGPARDWLQCYTGLEINQDSGQISMDWNDYVMVSKTADIPVTLEIGKSNAAQET